MIEEYKAALNLLYGENCGDTIYDFVDKLCTHAFDNKISPEVPIILTTAMSPYSRFSGWYTPISNTIELVRYHCVSKKEGIVLRSNYDVLASLAHEFCHFYQYEICGSPTGSRGPHRCKSWYDSVTKASPYVCGVNIDGLCKPKKSVREGGRVFKIDNPTSLTEVELTHWPESVIDLAEQNDPRLQGRIIGTSVLDAYR